MTFSLDVFDWLRVEGFYITSNFIEERTVNPLELFKLLRFFFSIRAAWEAYVCLPPKGSKVFCTKLECLEWPTRVLKPTWVPFCYTILWCAGERSLHFSLESTSKFFSRFRRQAPLKNRLECKADSFLHFNSRHIMPKCQMCYNLYSLSAGSYFILISMAAGSSLSLLSSISPPTKQINK